LASFLKRAIKSYLQRLGRTVGRESFSNDTVKVRWLLINVLIDAWYQVTPPNLCRMGAELFGLFPFSIHRVLESTNVIDDEMASQFGGLKTARDLLNNNAQVIAEPDKMQAIAESLSGDHVGSLIVFDEGFDYRTIVHPVIYSDHLGTFAHTDPLLLARVSGDGLKLHCQTAFMRFKEI
jgi:hypothetical protein